MYDHSTQICMSIHRLITNHF